MARLRSVFLRVFFVLITAGVFMPGICFSQQPASGQGYTVAILPFSDLSGNSDLGQLSSVLPGMMQNALLQHTSLQPRQVQSGPGAAPNAPNQTPDVPTIAQAGQSAGASLALSGTLLTGTVSTKQGTFSGGRVGGIQIGGNSNHQSSTVTIQVVLVDTGKGVALGTLRATGKDTETHIDPNANTNYGNMNMQSGDFQNTSLGKATQKALDDLAKQIMVALKGFTPSGAAANAPAGASGQPMQASAPQQGYAQQQVQAPAPTQSQVLVYGDKDLFGTQYPAGVDPTAGAQLGNLVAGQVSTASQTYYYQGSLTPGFSDLGGQPDYPGTDQLYVGSHDTPPDNTQRGPQTIPMDYSSLVPAGQQVSGLTLGLSVTGFDSQDTGESFTARINGQIDVPLSRELNSLRMTTDATQFFAIGIDPKVLNSNNQLTLQIDATDPRNWDQGWAIDFLTISVATIPIPSPPPSAQNPQAPAASANGGSAQPGNAYANQQQFQGQPQPQPQQSQSQSSAPSGSPASAGVPLGSGVALPSGATVSAKDAGGIPLTFQPAEKVAFLFLASINTLERDDCLPHHGRQNLGRPCSLDELVSGVNSGSKIIGLTQDPRQDPNYRYSLQTLGSNYEIAAVPQSGGLGGFLLDGPADFRYHRDGVATLADKKFSEFEFTGNGFLRQ